MPQGTSTVHVVDLIIQLHLMYVAGYTKAIQWLGLWCLFMHGKSQ